MQVHQSEATPETTKMSAETGVAEKLQDFFHLGSLLCGIRTHYGKVSWGILWQVYRLHRTARKECPAE